MTVGEEIVNGGFSLLSRWKSGGLNTIINDVTHVTNWDGRYNPNVEDGLEIPGAESLPQEEEANEKEMEEEEEEEDSKMPALPNMPSCPITGLPMIDPVVAADGHTYERYAIARWLRSSDKSPLTGSILPHKELVPNYGLLSSLQEAANALRSVSSSTLSGTSIG